MDKSNRIGILGGSFDPIHLGHINMGLRALEDFGLDQVFYVVAKTSPFKINNTQVSAGKRFELVDKALEKYPKLLASDYEVRADEKVSYSYKTVEYFKTKYPDSKLFWIMGKDAFKDIYKWKNYSYLMDNLEFIVFSRGEEEAVINTESKVNYVSDFNFGVSSSEIRDYFQNNLVNSKVENYLIEEIRDLSKVYYSSKLTSSTFN